MATAAAILLAGGAGTAWVLHRREAARLLDQQVRSATDEAEAALVAAEQSLKESRFDRAATELERAKNLIASLRSLRPKNPDADALEKRQGSLADDRANRAKGMLRFEGRWVTPAWLETTMGARGFVKDGEEWIRAAEFEKRQKERGLEHVDGRWMTAEEKSAHLKSLGWIEFEGALRPPEEIEKIQAGRGLRKVEDHWMTAEEEKAHYTKKGFVHFEGSWRAPGEFERICRERGLEEVEGQWLDAKGRAAYYAAHGWVQFEGKWMPPAEVEAVRRGRGEELVEGRWLSAAERERHYKAKGWVEVEGRWCDPAEADRIRRESRAQAADLERRHASRKPSIPSFTAEEAGELLAEPSSGDKLELAQGGVAVFKTSLGIARNYQKIGLTIEPRGFGVLQVDGTYVSATRIELTVAVFAEADTPPGDRALDLRITLKENDYSPEEKKSVRLQAAVEEGDYALPGDVLTEDQMAQCFVDARAAFSAVRRNHEKAKPFYEKASRMHAEAANMIAKNIDLIGKDNRRYDQILQEAKQKGADARAVSRQALPFEIVKTMYWGLADCLLHRMEAEAKRGDGPRAAIAAAFAQLMRKDREQK